VCRSRQFQLQKGQFRQDALTAEVPVSAPRGGPAFRLAVNDCSPFSALRDSHFKVRAEGGER